MKATPYRTVRDGVISRMGIDPAQPLMASQATALAEYLTTAAATAWTFFDWPEVYLTEARTPEGDGFQTGVYTYESDYVGTTSYIGRAVQGSSFADLEWRIKRVTTTAAGDLLNIDTAVNVAWDDRTTATYIETSANEAAEDEFPYIPLVAQGLKPIGTVLKILLRFLTNSFYPKSIRSLFVSINPLTSSNNLIASALFAGLAPFIISNTILILCLIASLLS